MRSSPAASEERQRFHGLFIGVNRYASCDIDQLASAVRDASALHALFSDNLGGSCQLVTDEDATTGRLRAEIEALRTSSSADDVVVIAFSGHGSSSHEIVTYDANLYDLPSTALPLDELTELVSAIPARHLLVVLDCCFSGGAGAKVLNAPLAPRGGSRGVPLSTEALLSKMAGTGRLILTASTASQPAWEDLRLGHGLLTYHLLQALLGARETAGNGHISLLDLLQYVTQQVKSGASGLANARQDPTLRGQWDGEVFWPVFRPGPLYSRLFPPQATSPVTADVQSLRGRGIAELVLEGWTASLASLNRLQQDAVNEAGLLDGRNVLVMAPTSSGKTMIGELPALQATQHGGRSVFLLPTKALVNEQLDKFTRLYGPAGVRTIRATGDLTDQIPALLRGQFDIAVLTYEMFTRLALANPHLLRIVSVIVVDEVQTLVDPGRGPRLELLLTLIRSRRDIGVAPQVITLSAVLGDLGGLDSWLEAHLLRRTERPVPLEEGVLDLAGTCHSLGADGTARSEQLIPPQPGEARAKTLLIPLVRKLVADGQQVIVIRATRGDTRGAARYLAQSLGLPAAAEALAALPAGDPGIASNGLRGCLAGGVAFHNSDLDRDERRVIEDFFRQPGSAIRVVVATTTLAQGVNLPAETVVIPELRRRVGRTEYRPYSVAEYKNIAGRAGRLGLTERGRAIVLAYTSADISEAWSKYINGVPEDVHSTLLSPSADLYTLILSVVAIAAQHLDAEAAFSQDDVIAFLASSFAAHQNRLNAGADAFEPSSIGRVLAELRRYQFVEDHGAGLRLTSLGAAVAESGLAVRSAVAVAEAFRGLDPQTINRATLVTAAQLTAELDDTRLTVNPKGIQTEFGTFARALSQQRTAPAVLNAISQQAPDGRVAAARAKKAVACLLWMTGTPAAQLEQVVMKHCREKDAIGPVRAVASRTQDVIGVIISIVGIMHPTADLARLTELLPVQLELGIPDSVVPLANAGANLSRENYLALVSAGLDTPELINEADDDDLLKRIGENSDRLRALRDAVRHVLEEAAVPALDEVLPPPRD